MCQTGWVSPIKTILMMAVGLVGGCGADAPMYEDANYAGDCKPPNGAYLIHCENVTCNDGNGGCASQPDIVVIYRAGAQLSDPQGWTVTTLQTTPNACIRNTTLSNANGSTRSAIVQSSADGHHLHETFTEQQSVGGGLCTTNARLDWQQ
jgi:hypothetical protein